MYKSLKANKEIKLNNLDFAHMQVSGKFVLVKGLFTIFTCILRYVFSCYTSVHRYTKVCLFTFICLYLSVLNFDVNGTCIYITQM